MWNGTMFVDLDWPLNASSLLSASAELLVESCRGAWYDENPAVFAGDPREWKPDLRGSGEGWKPMLRGCPVPREWIIMQDFRGNEDADCCNSALRAAKWIYPVSNFFQIHSFDNEKSYISFYIQESAMHIVCLFIYFSEMQHSTCARYARTIKIWVVQ